MPDILLQTISTLGHMSLERFNSAFDAVQIRRGPDLEINLNDIRRRSVRFLDSLGHCEFDFEKRMVFACPPALVTLPVYGLPNAVLTGARTPSLIQKIRDFIKNNNEELSYSKIQQVNPEYSLPSAILIEAAGYEQLNKLSQEARIHSHLIPPASWSLINFSSGIEDIAEGLFYEKRNELDWDMRFSEEDLRFYRDKLLRSDENLVSYKNRINQKMKHFIYDGKNAAEIDRDWGRYIMLAKCSKNILLYDKRRYLLVVPSTVPLPRFFGRAAALCSGLAPKQAYMSNGSAEGLPGGHPVDIYYSVPPAIAQLIAKKLSQELINYSIVTDQNGVIA